MCIIKESGKILKTSKQDVVSFNINKDNCLKSTSCVN